MTDIFELYRYSGLGASLMETLTELVNSGALNSRQAHDAIKLFDDIFAQVIAKHREHAPPKQKLTIKVCVEI